jgi:isoquinoline 1-oxidoreductase alpha subunit
MKLDLNINGKPVSVDVPPDMPLLWVLRDVLQMHGTKFGCGAGQCGACTVHMRGRAMKSCQVQASTAAGAPIVTIEGLTPNGTHPLQEIWRELDVPDCGYCQGGQIMAAAALLATTPTPTDAQIDTAMSGNICRCGTYVRIREGIHRAAVVAAANNKKGTL